MIVRLDEEVVIVAMISYNVEVPDDTTDEDLEDVAEDCIDRANDEVDRTMSVKSRETTNVEEIDEPSFATMDGVRLPVPRSGMTDAEKNR